jgi:putative membrane protein
MLAKRPNGGRHHGRVVARRIAGISRLFLRIRRACRRLPVHTPHDEFGLIRANVPAAAIALGLSLLGFALPVASAIAHSANIVDCAIWSVIALIVQVIAYFVAQIPDRDLSKRIAAGELASAVWLGLVSVTAGLLSAASMSY